MEEILTFEPAILSRYERNRNGVMACRTRRAAHGPHEFRLLQRRHLIALQLSPARITSSDRIADQAWPKRERAVMSRINIVPAGADWVSQTEAQMPSEYVAVFIPDEFLDDLDDGAKIRRAIFPALDAELPAILRVMQALGDDLSEPVYGDLFLEGALRMLASALGRRNAPNRSDRPGALLSSRQMRVLDDMIDARLHEALAVHDIVVALGASEGVLTRSTLKAFGVTPYRLIIERRIERAKRLLAHSQTSLVCVGLQCGFEDQAHFTTAFKKRVGVTPGRYRRERTPENEHAGLGSSEWGNDP